MRLRRLRTMMMSEKQRAYRYGMTLLCIGAFFNWLGLNEDNSDPLRFIGFTCLSSGALLVCLAICMWANSPRQQRANNDPEAGGEGEVRVEVGETLEKPPDYDTLAALATPPPCYLDAIKLSPLALALSEREREENADSVELPDGSRRSDSNIKEGESSNGETSRIGRMIKISTRILRRTVSSPAPPAEDLPPRPPVHRAISMMQEPKDT